MLKVMLVSMPYTIITMPSVGIAQLQAIVREKLPEVVQIDTAYCYIDFAEFMGGRAQYDALGAYSDKMLAEWMFRKVAFDAPDDVDSYRRFFFSDGDFPRKRKVFDLALSKRQGIETFLDRLIASYRLEECQVVGFTSMMSQNLGTFALARRLKAIHPGILTCFGGANAEHPMGRTVVQNVPQIDYAFSGEGLVNFPAFLRAVVDGDRDRMGSLRGVHSRVAAGSPRARATANRVFGSVPIVVESSEAACGTSDLERNSGEAFNLNELPMLDYSEYLDRLQRSSLQEKMQSELVLPFQTSTGCWWADKVPCSFCGLTPHAFRQMTPQKARDYISGLIDAYKDRFWIFEATDPCMPVEYPQEVFSHVNRDKAALLQYEVKANMAVADLVAMAEANVILPQPGIESLSTRTLKIMRKGVTAFHNVKFLKDCTEQGLYPIWNYLFGFPNADYDELDGDKLSQDARTLSHLPPPSSFMPIMFPRYSEYFNERERYGLKLEPLKQYAFIYPFEKAVIADLAYFFGDDDFVRRMLAKYQKSVHAIRLEIVEWMMKFRTGIPKLRFVGELRIEDTRFARPAEHRVSALEREILLFLNEPRSAESIQRHFDLPPDTVSRTLEKFTSARFLFSERGKHLSVVCERCALTADIYKNYYVDFVKSTATAFD